MDKRVSASQAKAHLSSLIAEVAFGEKHVIIERRGKPLAALVPVSDLERTREQAKPVTPRGALALLGLLNDLGDDDVDAMVADIYADRARDLGRHVDLDA